MLLNASKRDTLLNCLNTFSVMYSCDLVHINWRCRSHGYFVAGGDIAKNETFHFLSQLNFNEKKTRFGFIICENQPYCFMRVCWTSENCSFSFKRITTVLIKKKGNHLVLLIMLNNHSKFYQLEQCLI